MAVAASSHLMACCRFQEISLSQFYFCGAEGEQQKQKTPRHYTFKVHWESTLVTQWERNVQRQIDPLVITLRDIVGNDIQLVLSSKEDTEFKSFDGKVLNISLQNTIL